ncbi:hypothetical protein ISCGN_005346 [Ixodes scapularis]
MSSEGVSTTALAGRGFSVSAPTDEYQVVLPSLPRGALALNTVILRCDSKNRPYRIEDFKQELERLNVLKEVASIGAYQMNHVWIVTLRSSAATYRLVSAKELTVKGRRCLVIDPSNAEERPLSSLDMFGNGILLDAVLLLGSILQCHAKRPNIVFILGDDLGWGDVSFHGSTQIPTPNIDVLAGDGVILNNYYVLPTCTPSRAALMTGLYPIHTGMQSDIIEPAAPWGLPLENKILPQHFRDLGYDVNMIGKGWGDVSFHGSTQIPTPNIDVLAGDGVILNNYYVLPTCTPSRAALMTGLYPIHTGMQSDIIEPAAPWGLPLENKILPQHFRDLGYDVNMIGKWHLGFFKTPYVPIKRGFDTFFGFYTGSNDYYNHTSGSENNEQVQYSI